MTMMDDSYTPKGWQCPVCGRVYAPDWPWCVNCGGGQNVVTTDTLVTNTGAQESEKSVMWPNEEWYTNIINRALNDFDKQENRI